MGDNKAERCFRIQITKSVVAIRQVSHQLLLFVALT
jgi:hypothetical protein